MPNDTSHDTFELKARIPGWGSDLDPARRPGVPKEKAPPIGTGAHWSQPEQQPESVRVFKTIARDGLTPVFGTACPPKLLSGRLRATAYRMHEGWISRWVLLLFADRVDMFESIVGDVLTGKAGNPFAEAGLGVELRESGRLARPQRRRALMIGTLGLGAAVAGLSALRGGRKPARSRARAA